MLSGNVSALTGHDVAHAAFGQKARAAKIIRPSTSWHFIWLLHLSRALCLHWGNYVMVTKWPLSQREKHELTPRRLQKVFILWRTDGRMDGGGWQHSPEHGGFQRFWWETPGRRWLCPTLKRRYLRKTVFNRHLEPQQQAVNTTVLLTFYTSSRHEVASAFSWSLYILRLNPISPLGPTTSPIPFRTEG